MATSWFIAFAASATLPLVGAAWWRRRLVWVLPLAGLALLLLHGDSPPLFRLIAASLGML